MKKMLEYIGTLSIVLILVLAIFLVGCAEDKPKEWTSFTEPLGETLIEEVQFDDELLPIEMNLISTMYGFDDTNLTDYKVYMGSGGTADEIGIFFAKDEAMAGDIEQAVKTRVEDQVLVMKDYLPEEVNKLDNAVIHAEGPYVVLCVSGDPEKAKEVISGYFNK